MEEFEQYIPADKNFLAQLDAAFEKQRAILHKNIDAMRQLAALEEEGYHANAIDEDGEEAERFNPDYMELVDKEIVRY